MKQKETYVQEQDLQGGSILAAHNISDDKQNQTIFNQHQQSSIFLSKQIMPQYTPSPCQDEIPEDEIVSSHREMVNNDKSDIKAIQSVDEKNNKDIAICIDNSCLMKQKKRKIMWFRVASKVFMFVNKLKKRKVKQCKKKKTTILLTEFAMNGLQYEIINDAAAVDNINEFKQIISTKKARPIKKMNILKFQKLIHYILQQIPIFDLQSKIIIMWQAVIAGILALGLFYVTYKFAFVNWLLDFDEIYLKNLFSIALITDIIVQMNTSYFDKGQPVMKREDLIKKYFKQQMFFDLITLIIPLICSFFPNHELTFNNITIYCIVNLGQLLFLGKVVSFQKFISDKLKGLSYSQTVNALICIIFLFVKLLFIVHLVGCLWYFIGRQELKIRGIGWLEQTDLYNQEPFKQYIHTLYDSILLLALSQNSQFRYHLDQNSSIQQQQLQEDTDLERCMKIFIALLGIHTIAYVFNSQRQIFKKYYQQENHYRQIMHQLNMYLSRHEVNPFLKKRALKYLERQRNEFTISEYENQLCKKQEIPSTQMMMDNSQYMVNSRNIPMQVRHSTPSNVEQLLNFLPAYIKGDIIQDANIKYIQKVDFLIKNFSREFLLQLAGIMQENIYNSDEVIKLQKTQEQPSLNIVASGEIELYIDIDYNNLGEGFPRKTLEKLGVPGGCYGQLEFFSFNQEALYSVRATCLTRVLNVKLADFLTLLQKFNRDNEVFCLMRDEVMLYHNYSKINYRCHSCKVLGACHTFLECPYLFYGRITKNVMDKINKEIYKKIKDFKRNPEFKKNPTLLNLIETQDKALAFREEYIRQKQLEQNLSNLSNSDSSLFQEYQVNQESNQIQDQQSQENISDCSQLQSQNIKIGQLKEMEIRIDNGMQQILKNFNSFCNLPQQQNPEGEVNDVNCSSIIACDNKKKNEKQFSMDLKGKTIFTQQQIKKTDEDIIEMNFENNYQFAAPECSGPSVGKNENQQQKMQSIFNNTQMAEIKEIVNQFEVFLTSQLLQLNKKAEQKEQIQQQQQFLTQKQVGQDSLIINEEDHSYKREFSLNQNKNINIMFDLEFQSQEFSNVIKLKNFELFFPHNNFNSVIKEYNNKNYNRFKIRMRKYSLSKKRISVQHSPYSSGKKKLMQPCQ